MLYLIGFRFIVDDMLIGCAFYQHSSEGVFHFNL